MRRIIIHLFAEYKLKKRITAMFSHIFHFGFTAFTLVFSFNSAFTVIIKA